jgi:hypothetical protein
VKPISEKKGEKMIRENEEGIYWNNLELESSQQRVRMRRLLTIFGSVGEFVHFPTLMREMCWQKDSDFLETLGYCWYISKKDIISMFPIYETIKIDGYDVTITMWYIVFKEYPNFFLEGY